MNLSQIILEVAILLLLIITSLTNLFIKKRLFGQFTLWLYGLILLVCVLGVFISLNIFIVQLYYAKDFMNTISLMLLLAIPLIAAVTSYGFSGIKNIFTKVIK